MPGDLIPEDELCLLLARGRFSPGPAQRARDRLGAGVRWEVLYESAIAQGLMPLVYLRLRGLEFRGMPPSVLRRWKDTFGVNAMRNVLLGHELASVLKALGAAGVPAIPLKGIALAESLYGDPALRACADLDILIQPKDLKESLHALRQAGYSDRFGNPRLVHLLARHGKDCAMTREADRTKYTLQVHCGLIWGGAAESRLSAEIWSEATPRPFHDAPALAMSPEWQFLYLAVHAVRHGLFPFKWLVDLDWIVARTAVDWNKVYEQAQRHRWESIVQSCFAACAAFLETPAPAPFAQTAHRNTAATPPSSPGPLAIPRETLFALRLLPTLAQRFLFLGARLLSPTPADVESLRLPDSMFFLYYLWRPLRLTGMVAGWTFQATAAKVRRLRTEHVRYRGSQHVT